MSERRPRGSSGSTASSDILINNAGITIPVGPPSNTTSEEVRRVYETNVFGVIEVTRAMLPLLPRSSAGGS
ncbi:SDR family NAD(P)-dependent oxidoreductase [Nonomuraea sp. NPDC023979]|uniref:SDR family NAD(P)-dependent oxidoreductase n=1 Tax=Nonomuraea sp. NPDC023979 TaxID=3154796 RepID=UPI0034096294